MPPTLYCPDCQFPLDHKLANVQTDLIQCSHCYAIHKLSRLLEAEALEYKEFDEVENPIEFPQSLDNQGVVNKERDWATPLLGSKITYYWGADSSLLLHIPPRKLSALDIFPILFSVFWLSFVTVWTTFAFMGAGFFALFSIPFWLVGFSMASYVVNGLTERQFIELDRYQLTIKKRRLLFSQIYELDVEDIDAITMKKADFKNSFKMIGNLRPNTDGQSSSAGVKLPTIQAGIKNVTFMESVTEAEMEWGVQLLRQALVRIAKRRG